MWFVQGGGWWEKVSSELFNTNVKSSHFSVGEYCGGGGENETFCYHLYVGCHFQILPAYVKPSPLKIIQFLRNMIT